MRPFLNINKDRLFISRYKRVAQEKGLNYKILSYKEDLTPEFILEGGFSNGLDIYADKESSKLIINFLELTEIKKRLYIEPTFSKVPFTRGIYIFNSQESYIKTSGIKERINEDLSYLTENFSVVFTSFPYIELGYDELTKTFNNYTIILQRFYENFDKYIH